MAGAGITITAEAQGFDSLRAAIRNTVNLTMRPRGLMAAIGRRVQQQTKRRFQDRTAPDGTPWAPKLPLFVKLEGGKSAPLTFTGALLRSIVHQEPDDQTTQVGSALPYAARMQFGGGSSKPAPLWIEFPAAASGIFYADDEPGMERLEDGRLTLRQTPGARLVFMQINVRPRPYLGLSEANAKAVLEDVEEYLARWFLSPLRGKEDIDG